MTDVLSFFDEQTFVNDKRIELTDVAVPGFYQRFLSKGFFIIEKLVQRKEIG